MHLPEQAADQLPDLAAAALPEQAAQRLPEQAAPGPAFGSSLETAAEPAGAQTLPEKQQA